MGTGDVLGTAQLLKPRQTLPLQRCPLDWGCRNAAGELPDLGEKGAMGQRGRCSTTEGGDPHAEPPLSSSSGPGGFTDGHSPTTPTPLWTSPFYIKSSKDSLCCPEWQSPAGWSQMCRTGDDGVCETLLCPQAALLYMDYTSARCLSWNPQPPSPGNLHLLQSNSILGLLLGI